MTRSSVCGCQCSLALLIGSDVGLCIETSVRMRSHLRRCLHSATDYEKSTCKVVLAAHEAKRRLFTLQLSLEKQSVYSILINSTPPRRPSSCNANHFKNRFISVRSSDEYLILIWHVMMFFFTCLRRHYRSEHRGIYFTKKPMTATYLR